MVNTMASFNNNRIRGNSVSASATFTQDEISMPKAKGSMLPAIIKITVQRPRLNKLDDKYSQWALVNKFSSAMPNFDDEEVIAMKRTESGSKGATTGGSDPDNVIEEYVPAAPIPIASSKLYFLSYQDTGSSHTYRYHIDYVPRSVPGVVQKENLNVQDVM